MDFPASSSSSAAAPSSPEHPPPLHAGIALWLLQKQAGAEGDEEAAATSSAAPPLSAVAHGAGEAAFPSVPTQRATPMSSRTIVARARSINAFAAAAAANGDLGPDEEPVWSHVNARNLDEDAVHDITMADIASDRGFAASSAAAAAAAGLLLPGPRRMGSPTGLDGDGYPPAVDSVFTTKLATNTRVQHATSRRKGTVAAPMNSQGWLKVVYDDEVSRKEVSARPSALRAIAGTGPPLPPPAPKVAVVPVAVPLPTKAAAFAALENAVPVPRPLLAPPPTGTGPLAAHYAVGMRVYHLASRRCGTVVARMNSQGWVKIKFDGDLSAQSARPRTVRRITQGNGSDDAEAIAAAEESARAVAAAAAAPKKEATSAARAYRPVSVFTIGVRVVNTVLRVVGTVVHAMNSQGWLKIRYDGESIAVSARPGSVRLLSEGGFPSSDDELDDDAANQNKRGRGNASAAALPTRESKRVRTAPPGRWRTDRDTPLVGARARRAFGQRELNGVVVAYLAEKDQQFRVVYPDALGPGRPFNEDLSAAEANAVAVLATARSSPPPMY